MHQILRMNRDNVRESLEIRPVECKQVADLMYFQNGGHMCVVDFCPANIMRF